MPRAAPLLSSFNAGELSPHLEGRADVAKYQSGGKLIENFIPMIQGPAQRRAGTRYVAEVKTSANKTWLVRFVYSASQSYILEFGNQYIRFYTNHGQVQYLGSPYEIASPWTTADLVDANGFCALRFIESNDVVYICHRSYAPRKLSRLGATNWTLTTVGFTGGPFKTINDTATTVVASAQTGTVTVVASTGIFTAAMVGSLFYIQQPSVINVTQWEAGKAILINELRRSNGVTYKALNSATTGGNKPTHNDGAVYDGDTGVKWQYQDPGYGYGLITGYTSATQVTMDVVDPIPYYACGLNTTTNWAFGAWSDVDGWPSQVTFFKERLCFGRGQNVWLSVSGDYENFASKDDLGVVAADCAISLTLQSGQNNDLQWMLPINDSLLCGTAGSEFSIQPITSSQPFAPDNATAVPVSDFGARNIPPVRIGDATLFVQRSGLRSRDIIYDFMSNRFQSTDQNTFSDHITRGGIVGQAYQQDPNSLLWQVRADGLLVCMTYSREQNESPPFGGWHRHRIGGSFGSVPAVVECGETIPSPAGDRDELWMIVKRTINGSTKRYIEYIEYERRSNDDPEDSFYVDSGLTLNNTIAATLTPGTGATVAGTAGVTFTAGSAVFSAGDVGRIIKYRYATTDSDGYAKVWQTARAKITGYTSTTIVTAKIEAAFPSLAALASGAWRMTVTTVSGLGHLEGQQVHILGDGAVIEPQTVASGSITLPVPCAKAQVGLACPAKLQTLRLNAGAADGTAQGKTARINKLSIRLFETCGLSIGNTFDEMDRIDFRNVNDPMDAPPALFTGDKLVDFPGDYTTDPWICLMQPDPLPATIVAIMPILSTYDRS